MNRICFLVSFTAKNPMNPDAAHEPLSGRNQYLETDCPRSVTDGAGD